MKKIIRVALVTSMLAYSTGQSFCQNVLQFTGVNATPEGAVQLHWASNTNEVYEIDEADALNTNSDGSTFWNTLYTQYPSHGTNTFIADSGNYDLYPAIPHPKYSPMRFYRVVYLGTNTSPTNPNVAITYPTNETSLSGNVTISVSSGSAEMLTSVRLFIDGEEQWPSSDGTNFTINTCEWPNGQHTLFAIAKSQSAIEGFSYNYPITYGSQVSSYVDVAFNNLITEFSLSQPYFEPALGQTQQASAIFTANVNWTLEIQNAESNDVLYVTGSGGSMAYNWDGTGTNEANIPDGVYSYLLTVQTNGESLPSGGGGGGSPSGAPSPDFALASSSTADSVMQWALPENAPNPVPLALFPPGFNTNGFTVFEASPSQMRALNATIETANESGTTIRAGKLTSSLNSDGEFAFDTAGGGESSQSTRGPTRKPRIGVKNASATFGICYQTYPNQFVSQEPRNGEIAPLQVFTGVDGQSPNSGLLLWSDLKSSKLESDGFAEVMKIGWTNGSCKPVFIKSDGQWGPQDIKKSSLGGNSIFNNCNFGLLLTHGCYGTQPEIDGVKYTYLALYDAVHGSSYLRLSDMNFGSSGTSGLRWMTILSCNMLFPANVTSMANNSKLPDNSNLHLLLGATTPTYATPDFGALYASNLVYNVPIWTSFQNAGLESYAYAQSKGVQGMTNTVTFRVIGNTACMGDELFLYSDPDPNAGATILNQTVFTP